MRCEKRRRKSICLLLALLQVVTLLVPVFPLGYAATEKLDGDVNSDGIVNSEDLAVISAHVARISQITDEETLERADLNGDGILSAADITALSVLLKEAENIFAVTNVSVNQQTGESGTIFSWTAEVKGGTGEVEYAFQLVDCSDDAASGGENTVVAEQDYSTLNQFHASILDPGTYAITVSCRDEEGQICSASVQAPVTVTAPGLQILRTDCTSQGNICYVGEELNWSVYAEGGTPPYQYSYSLLQNSEQVFFHKSSRKTCSWIPEEPGEYILQISCTDAEGNVVYADSESVTVRTERAGPASAPILAAANDKYAVTGTADTAQYIPCSELRFCWNAIDNATAYEIILESRDAESWREIESVNTADLNYTVSPELLSEWSTNTLFRLRISSQGKTSTDENMYFFYSRAQAKAVYVDDEVSVNWSISGAEATSRSFAVSADSAWTVTADAAWIIITPEEQGFTAQVTENTEAERSGTITVSDGSDYAYVLVTQGVGNGAPELYYPVYSADPDQPTEIPVGGMILGFDPMDAKYVSVRILEKSPEGQLTEVYQGFAPEKEEYHQVVTSYNFQSNTDYVIELSGSVTEAPDPEAAKNFYYVRMVNKDHKILVEGSPEYTVDSFTDFNVTLYSSGAWTYTTDADWLRPEDYYSVTYKKDYQTVTILLQPNETYETRTGTITFFCGDASATLTVTQKSCLPHFVMPADVSQDMNNPTILPSKGFVEKAIYQSGTYATFENGVWSEESSWGSSTDICEWTTLYPDDFFRTDVLYRFTMHIGEYTAVYYAKFSDSVREPYAVTRWGVEDFIDLQLSFTTAESEDYVDLSTSGAWSITSDSSWLSVSAASGSKAVYREEITITAAENTTGQVRTGILTFRSEGRICATVTVTQSARDYMMIFLKDDDSDYLLYDPGTSFKNLDGSKTSVTFRVESPLSHTVTSSDSWITCKKTSLTLTANTTGKRRSGTVVISNGKATETITVTQEAQLALPTLVSPALSTTESSPSVMKNGDMELVFNGVEGAVRYVVCVSPADRSLLLPDSNFYSFRTEIQADGASTYSCLIPRGALSVDAENCDEISIFAYDSFGYGVYEDFFVKTTGTGAAMINGTTAPVWDNATDIAVSEGFVVRSTGAWKAVSRSSWITLDKTGGNDGDTLTLTLQANTGAARTGTVLITVGNSETVLTVNQCAWLPEYPAIGSPVFSDDPAMPTVIGNGTTSLHVTWNYEPQAEYYKVFLLSFKSNSVQHIEASSPKLNCGEYTFDNLILEPGQRYSLKITRKSHWGNTAKSYFFTLSDANAFVLADDLTELTVEMEGGEDFYSPTITSSGVWSASVSDDWILVDNERIKQADMDLDGYVPADFSRYSGLSGDDLYISVLPNPTDSFRYGTVTLRCGSAESTVSIVQEPNYVTADIYSPNLADTRQNSTSLPYGAVTLRWSGASGGTGTYRLVVYERDEEKEYRYYEIAEIDNISDTCYTLPLSMLTEGQYYKIWLGTAIKGTDDYPGRWYYFRVGYRNELVARVTTDWTTVGKNGFVTVNASAAGGAGEYRFSYELLRNGKQISITELDDWDYYTFNIRETGNYQVRVYVRDAAGQGANTLSASYTVGEEDLVTLGLSQKDWQLGADGGSISVAVESYNAWKIISKPGWVSCSAMEGYPNAEITLTVGANSQGERIGTIVFSGSGKTAELTVRQSGASLSIPEVTRPAEGTTVKLQDLDVSWNAVSSASSYVFRLRDLTTDTLLIYDIGVKTTGATIPAGYLTIGHSYRIAVGAVREGDSPTSGSVAWDEQVFQVSASDNAATLAGSVTSSEGNPLHGARILISHINEAGDQIYIAETGTDENGQWQAQGLVMNKQYLVAVSLDGYIFEPNQREVTTSASAITDIHFQAANSNPGEDTSFGAEMSYIEFAPRGGNDEIYIVAPAGWTAEIDADWISMSSYSGDNSQPIHIIAEENPENATRYGSITFYETTKTRGLAQYYVVDIVQSAKAFVIKTVGTGSEQTSIFDNSGSTSYYTGAELAAGTAYSSQKNLIISQDMYIPASASVQTEGDIYINGAVTMDASAWLMAHGSVYVMAGGSLNLSSGGNVAAGKDFLFQSGIDHTEYLRGGTIYVGGNVTLQRNFYASGSNEFYLIDESETHEIHVRSLTGKPQHFNNLILKDQGLDALIISAVFQCKGRLITNASSLLQGVRQTSGAYSIKPCAEYETAFRKDARSSEILANVHVGLLRAIIDQGTITTAGCYCQSTREYSYIDDTGVVRSYTVHVDYHAGVGSGATAGTVEYTQTMNNGQTASYKFYVSGDVQSLANSAKEFKNALRSASADAFENLTLGYAKIYRDALQSMVADCFDAGTDLARMSVFAQEKYVQTLCQNNDLLQKCCSATRVLDQLQPDPTKLGQPSLELRLNDQIIADGYEHELSFVSGDTIWLDVKPANTDHLYRSWQGDPTQNQVWSSREIVNGDWTSIAVTIPQYLESGRYRIQVEASNSAVYNNPSAQKTIVTLYIQVTASTAVQTDLSVRIVDGGYVYKEGVGRAELVKPYYYLDPARDIDKSADVESLKLIIDQFDVLNHHNSSAGAYGSGFYYPSGTATYCTTYARDVANAFGACFPMSVCSKCGLVKYDTTEMGKNMLDFLKQNNLTCSNGCTGSASSLKAFQSKEANRTDLKDPFCFMMTHGSKFGWKHITSNKVEEAMKWAGQGYLVLGLYSDYKKPAGHAFVVYPSDSGIMHQAQAGSVAAMTDGSTAWNVNNNNGRRNPNNEWIEYFVYVGLPD